MGLLDSLIGPVAGLLDKVIPDKDQAAALAHQIATMSERQSGDESTRTTRPSPLGLGPSEWIPR